MKINKLMLPLLLAVTSLVFLKCQKASDVRTSSPEKLVVTKIGSLHFSTPAGRIADSVDISSEGYLIIPTPTVLNNLKNYLITHTHGQVKAYLYSEGFASYGSTIYGTGYNSQTITQDQAANYIINTDKIVEIEKVLYRPISSSSCSTRSWDFVLLMDNSMLTTQTLTSLKQGSYDGNSMNQVATDPEFSSSGVETRQLMNSTPYGSQETTATSCASSASRRPMFGHAGGCCYQSGTETNPQTGQQVPVYWACNSHYYFFWIMVDNNGGCHISYGCIDYTPGTNCAVFPAS